MKSEEPFRKNLDEALQKGTDTAEKNSVSAAGKIDVFLSYSSLNKNVADAVVADFEQHGIRCWYAPRDIIPGQEWVTAIHEAIKSCRLFVLIYTDSSNESKQVANEVALAFNSGKTLIPFKLSDAEMSSELEYYLTRVHWLDAVKPPLRQSIESLRNYSETILGGKVPEESKIRNSNTVRNKKPSSFMIISAVAALAVIIIAGIFMLTKNKDSASVSSGKTYEKAYEYQKAARNKEDYDKAYDCYMQTGDDVCTDELITEAISTLASYYYNEGSEESVDRAVQLYKKAAASGSVSASNMLAAYYLENGQVSDAIRYYEDSAEKGDAVALYSLGYIYENDAGNYDIEPDNVKALAYYEKAEKAGHESASKACERIRKKTGG